MDNNKMADLLFPNVTGTIQDTMAKYPSRDLPEGAMVTRLAPSPTGFVHLGNLLVATIDKTLAKQSGGVCYLRVEDTDRVREVSGAIEDMCNQLSAYGIDFDEGWLGGDMGE